MSRKRSFWCRNGHFAVILAVFWLSFGSFDAFWLSFWQFWRILAVFLVNLAVFSSIWCHFGCILVNLVSFWLFSRQIGCFLVISRVFGCFLVISRVFGCFLVYLAVFPVYLAVFPCIWLYSRIPPHTPWPYPIPHGRTHPHTHHRVPHPMAPPSGTHAATWSSRLRTPELFTRLLSVWTRGRKWHIPCPYSESVSKVTKSDMDCNRVLSKWRFFRHFLTNLPCFRSFWHFWAQHPNNGSLGLGCGCMNHPKRQENTVIFMKPVMKRQPIVTVLHFFLRKARNLTFWPTFSQTAPSDPSRNGHFSLF